MEAKSRQTNIRTSARKIRRVIDAVRGKNVNEALNILRFMPYFAAKVVEKNVVAAIANATEKWGISPETLIISEIYADEGSTYKRVRPRAQGRMYKILKRSAHLTVKVSVNKNLLSKAK